MDFTLIKKAGMTQAEFGALVPGRVGRSTVNLWVSGKMRPNRYIKADVMLVLDRIARALKEKTLPLPEVDTDQAARVAEIRTRLSLN